MVNICAGSVSSWNFRFILWLRKGFPWNFTWVHFSRCVRGFLAHSSHTFLSYKNTTFGRSCTVWAKLSGLSKMVVVVQTTHLPGIPVYPIIASKAALVNASASSHETNVGFFPLSFYKVRISFLGVVMWLCGIKMWKYDGRVWEVRDMERFERRDRVFKGISLKREYWFDWRRTSLFCFIWGSFQKMEIRRVRLTIIIFIISLPIVFSVQNVWSKWRN